MGASAGCKLQAVSGLVYRKHLVGSRWAASLLLCMNGLRKQTFHLVGPPLLVLKVYFTVWTQWHSQDDSHLGNVWAHL